MCSTREAIENTNFVGGVNGGRAEVGVSGRGDDDLDLDLGLDAGRSMPGVLPSFAAGRAMSYDGGRHAPGEEADRGPGVFGVGGDELEMGDAEYGGGTTRSLRAAANEVSPYREAYACRRRRGKTRMLIVGEEEAREKRREALAAIEDPGMEGIRVALMAMEARKRQLYNPYSYVERSELDPAMRDLENRQRDSEVLSVDKEVERYKEEMEKSALRGEAANLPTGRRILQGFYGPLVSAIAAEQELVRLKIPGPDRLGYGSFLLMLNPEKLAVITLHVAIGELMKGTDRFGVGVTANTQSGLAKFVKVVERLGEAVQAEVNLARMKSRARVHKCLERRDLEERRGVRDLAEDVADTEEFARKPHLHDRFMRVNLKSLRETSGVRGVNRLARIALEDSDWGNVSRVKLGTVLLNLLIDTAFIKIPAPLSDDADEVDAHAERQNGDGFGDTDDGFRWDEDREPELVEVPAFYHRFMYHKGLRIGTIAWHQAFYQFMEDEHMIRATLQPVRYMPMVTPPRPWTRYNAGGYLRSEGFVMRGHYTIHGPSRRQMIALNAEQSGAEAEGREPRFQPMLNALNVLGRTAWVINEPVLEVMEQVWEEGGGRCDIPPRANIEDPQWPSAPYGLRFVYGQMQATGLPSRVDVSNYIHAVNRAKAANRELHSQRCDFLIKLQVAREMRGEERIYFPHNVDFRGRAYTMHVHLNHLGSDICRGALLFADARPLGEKGLDWLYIQAANLYAGGVDKLPMDERRDWIKDRVERLEASARDPLGPDGTFWQEAEDPWQCLAVCKEIANARASGDPATYMCRLPVHQDGSCNGLQHYAALGRDEAGGEQVNLMPRDRPGDVYTGVAEVLKKIVARDKEGADDPAHVEYAKLLEPHIDRKLVKQTVMTSVYGVTHIGARQQIQNRLKERGAIENESVRYMLSNYAASKTLDAISDLFTNARDVMAWLAECAKVVCSKGRAVEWTTPMGLPVVQPYRAKARKVVRTVVQSIVLEYDSEENAVQKVKQRSAFPPNFIHSVDSAHMMMTALASHDAGLTFAGVHDSFWTHAGDVPEMSRLIREKFIELHKEPLLEKLYHELCEKYPELQDQIPPPPKPGKMDIELVRDSLYFFS